MMFRTVLRSENNSLTLTLPDELVGKRIEIIIFEAEENKSTNRKKLKLSELRGFLSLKTAEAMKKQISQDRAEWDDIL